MHASGRSEEAQLVLDDDASIPAFSRLVGTVKDRGARVGLQLTHAGAKTERGLTGGVLMGPGAIAVPVKDRTLESPEPMDAVAIELWKAWFIAAADRAFAAGFDIVELHAAHGYGLGQFLSPLTNDRTDAYGGTVEGRSRLLLEIVDAIRRRHPLRALAVRMGAQDFLPGGLTPEEGIAVAMRLEMARVDLIDVSSGLGGWRRPRGRDAEGYLVPEAARIARSVQVPVVGVGGIETLAYVDAALRRGDFALAAVGRAILEHRFEAIGKADVVAT